MRNSSKRRFAACSLAFAALIVFAPACKSPTEATPGAGSETAPVTSGSARVADSDATAKKAPAEDSKETAPASCIDDRDCSGYLRCVDKACIEPPAVTGEVRPDTPLAIFKDGESEVGRFRLELALASWETRRGLMYRRSMKDDWGMLFDFGVDGPRSFWMRNTLIPLDMVFIDARGRVVGVVEGAEPLTESPRGVGKPSRYVLEVNAGLANTLGLKEGAVMTLENAPETLQPE